MDNIKRAYFLGIGGIGMSALARYFRSAGKAVAGYDLNPTPLTVSLQKEGIRVHHNDAPCEIPEAFRRPAGTLVVYTPAVPDDLQEMIFFKEHHHRLFKRSEILGMLSAEMKTVAVAGTHGKTTVSTMVAFLLMHTTAGCNAFLGGISKNLNSNLIYDPESNWMVTEADEFDRSFLKLYPFAAVITAIDPDHLDVYGNVNEMHRSFDQFASQISENGLLLMKKDIPLDLKSIKARILTYSVQGKTDFYAQNIRLEEHRSSFDLVGPGFAINDISLEHPGMLNVENAVAASGIASLLGVESGIIRSAMGSFTGIRRRFDLQVTKENIVYIDDYGHHPKEIEATISSIRTLYPGRRLTGVFQPHLYTRTRDFADGFAESLGLLDELILLDIYPAREQPIPGISSEIILNRVPIRSKMLCRDDQLIPELVKRNIDILLTIGAGDIERFVEPIKKLYR
ncbi:MAG: UDP-N-acetylmuramate--L-alanine ligase [Bacteroidales bacterium]|nr:UDP-N-acetylmuramate--L-alanine ligase [Bacteroidales bacterium]